MRKHVQAKKSFYKGLAAEKHIQDFFEKKGFQILYHRYKTVFGEIDYILSSNNQLIFCEIKHRSSLEKAAFSLSEMQKKRLLNAGQFFLMRHPFAKDYTIQFDVFMCDAALNFLHFENVLLA